MALPPITLSLGISSILLLLIGYTYAILFIVKYFYIKKRLPLIVALVAFCCGSFYLGPTVSFINLILTEQNISANLYYILSYVWLPIGTLGIVIMGLNVFYPKLQKPATYFYGTIALVYWVFMFFFTSQQHVEEPIEAGHLLDVSHSGVSLIITGISLLSVLVIDSGGFFIFSVKLKKKEFPKRDVRKTFIIGLGWFLFFLSGVMDAVSPIKTVWFIIAVRSLMIFAFNFIYIGFWSKPTRIKAEN